MISIIVLGSGAGGGFPQWNSHAPACQRARRGDAGARARTQTSLAVSGDGNQWFLLNAAPDLRAQIEATLALHPRTGLRSSPIAGVALAGAEVDAIAGLLTLREGHRFSLHATRPTLARLDENPIFEVLARNLVRRLAIDLEVPVALTLPDGAASGLTLCALAVAGKMPLYQENAPPTGDDAAATIGLEISDGRSRLLFIPGCAAVTPDLRLRVAGAACLFFDATLWNDDEMITADIGRKTGAAMGHMSLAGPNGTLAALADVPVRRRILIHLNNSNPVLLEDTPERAAVRAAGWEVAHDGMAFTL